MRMRNWTLAILFFCINLLTVYGEYLAAIKILTHDARREKNYLFEIIHFHSHIFFFIHNIHSSNETWWVMCLFAKQPSGK